MMQITSVAKELPSYVFINKENVVVSHKMKIGLGRGTSKKVEIRTHTFGSKIFGHPFFGSYPNV